MERGRIARGERGHSSCGIMLVRLCNFVTFPASLVLVAATMWRGTRLGGVVELEVEEKGILSLAFQSNTFSWLY